MNYITCPKCNEENLGNTKCCIKCGASLTGKLISKKCLACGWETPDGLICERCGSMLREPAIPEHSFQI
jgi:hypothetical protein